MNRSSSLSRALLVLVALGGVGLVSVAALAACSSPAVGDMCSGSCTSPATCEVVCACGNPSCPTYVCVIDSSTGAYQLEDGGQVPSCSAL